MSLFNTIRSLFGFKAEVEESQQPIDQLDNITSQLSDKKSELVKAQREFDEINSELTLKLKACDKLIEKGVKEGEFNKNVIQQRLDKITDEFLTNIQTLSKQVSELEKEKIQVEGDILAKAIDLTSRLTKAEQQEINDIIVTWRETGLIKGQEIKSHTRAIVTALDEIVKGGGEGSRGGKIIGRTKSGKPIYDSASHRDHGSFSSDEHKEARALHEKKSMKYYDIMHNAGAPMQKRKKAGQKYSEHIRHANYHGEREKGDLQKSHEPLAIELAGKGDVIYDSPVEGHYANAIVCKYIKGEKYILFLKRAADKVVEPGKWCLPGGHIDEGETIEQAAARELKEEANLDSTGGYVRGKAKCDDGKWAFYVEISPDSHSLALLDGESQNATWMCREEWIEADLIFDLKDHLVAMESRSVNIKDIPDIMNPDTLKKSDDDSDLEKGGFHPQKPHHKYVRREGSPGNYTYYYDSPDMKSKDGKTQREGLYSSNVAPNTGEFKIGDKVKLKDGYDKNGRPIITEYTVSKPGMRRPDSKLREGEVYLTAPGVIGFDATHDWIRENMVKKNEENSLEKSIDINNPFYYDTEDDLIKGKRAQEGEERTWGGKTYQKKGGKWYPVKKSGRKKDSIHEETGIGHGHSVKIPKNLTTDPYDRRGQMGTVHKIEGDTIHVKFEDGGGGRYDAHALEKVDSKKQPNLSTKQLKEHAENTSTEQLKKVADNKDHPHNDAAKRELERREKDKEGDKPKHNTGYKSLDKALDSVKKKIPSLDIINKHRGIVEDEDDDGGNPKFTKEGYEQLWNDYVEEYSDGWADGDRGKPTAGDFFDFVDGATKSEYFEKQK